MTKRQTIIGFALWVALPFLAAAVGSRYMPGPWYETLAKPAWNPPNWIFAPVWTALYAMMGAAAGLVWRARGLRSGALPLGLFVAQLIANAAWTWLFFGIRAPGLAFADIIALWILIVLTLISFWRTRPLAGALLVPYILWVSFAAALNLRLWQLNS